VGLNNNRWTCNCDVLEVMQWAVLRRGQQPAHKPVKCLEEHQYRTLWTTAGGNRPCSESKTTEPVVTHNHQYTTGTVAVPESGTEGWASLLSWNVNTLMIFVILPITLGVAVFVALTAVNYIAKRDKSHQIQHVNQAMKNRIAVFSSSVPLLETGVTAKLMKSQGGYENRSSDGYRGAEFHVYERIE
jgi:hypothetical protein